MRKILIVTHWFYPRSNPRAFRSFELYRELNKDNDVDVLIGDWQLFLKSQDDYHEKLDRYNSQMIFNKNEKLSNSSLIQICKKIVQYFLGERYILSSGKFINDNIDLDKYDAVISIGLPFYIHLLVARKIAQCKKKIISISDWGDPFVGDKDRKLAPYFGRLQKYVCNMFDYVVTPTSTAIEYYTNFTSIDKIKVIPQGFRMNNVKIAKLERHSCPHFAYAGIFYEDKRNPTKLLEYLTSVDKNFKFTIYTIKHGDIYNKILKKYKEILREKLIINDIIPRDECIYELSKNDFLINIDNLSSVQIPSKLIDYGLTKRPILSFRQNEIPVDRFEEFFAGVYDNRRWIDLEEYDITCVSKKFIDLIDEMNMTKGE